ncbi:hypothetical protein PS3A_23730 [Pseudomonas sp. 3A(2025)]
MANGNYNYIYRELVESETDILGILAYSAYKRQKIEFIQGFRQKTGKEPSDTDLTPFNDLSNSASQLENYRNQANQLAQGFLDLSLQNQTEELQAYYSVRSSQEIKNSRPGFWQGVSQSVIGSVVFVLLLGFLVFFAWSLNQGPKQVIEQVFDVQIIDKKSARPVL